MILRPHGLSQMPSMSITIPQLNRTKPLWEDLGHRAQTMFLPLTLKELRTALSVDLYDSIPGQMLIQLIS